MTPLISIVIPNWNGKHLLEKCLTSINNLVYDNFEVIIVDNGSSDDSIEYISSNFPKIRLVPLASNTGFAHAVNVGIKACKGEYIALLNNDTEVDRYWLSELVKPFLQSQEIGIVASKLLNFYDRARIDSAGDVLNIVGQAYPIGGGELDCPVWNEGRFIFSATGGASAYRKSLLEEIGLFEEIFFMYFEDVDISYRAQRAGYKVWYQPSAVIYHIQKASSKKSRELLEYYLYRNFVVNYLINTPFSLFFKRMSIVKFIMVFVHTFYYQSKQGYIGSAIKTWWWLITNAGTIFSLRQKRQKDANPKVKDEYIESFIIDKKLKILTVRF